MGGNEGMEDIADVAIMVNSGGCRAANLIAIVKLNWKI